MLSTTFAGRKDEPRILVRILGCPHAVAVIFLPVRCSMGRLGAFIPKALN